MCPPGYSFNWLDIGRQQQDAIDKLRQEPTSDPKQGRNVHEPGEKEDRYESHDTRRREEDSPSRYVRCSPRDQRRNLPASNRDTILTVLLPAHGDEIRSADLRLDRADQFSVNYG